MKTPIDICLVHDWELQIFDQEKSDLCPADFVNNIGSITIRRFEPEQIEKSLHNKETASRILYL